MEQQDTHAPAEENPAAENAEILKNEEQQQNGEEDINGKIFIGGLSWQTTEETLRYYFEKYGELNDVALMVDKKTGKPRGFGFIKMKDPKAADVIMEHDHTIDGRLVDVKRALPRDKAPGPARSESCKIFVGGLAQEVSDADFGEYFSKFGPVKDAVVMVDRNTGSSRGFGFITFEKEESVEMVMKRDHEIKGKFIEIKRAEPRDSSGGPRGPGGYDMYNNYGPPGGGGYGQYPPTHHNGGRGGGGYGGGGYNNGGGGGRGGRGGRGGDGYGPGGYVGGMRSGYNRYQNAPGGAGGGGYAGGPGGYRGGGYGAPNVPPYGYGAPPMQGQPPMGYYPPVAPVGAGGGYANYGAAAGAGPAGGVPPGYGAGGYGAPMGHRPDAGAYGADPRAAGADPSKGYDNGALAGYNAAMQMRAQQPPPYGAPAAAPYGAAGGAPPQGCPPQAYGAPPAGYPPAAGGPPAGRDGYPPAADQGYGAYRGQGQGRADRSYRPY